MAIEQFGLFAEKPEAIKTLKQSMEDFCKLYDPRHQTLKLHFNNLWKLKASYTELFHEAMLVCLNKSSKEHAIVEKAVSHLDDDAKLRATEVALLAKVLVLNHEVIEIGHYSDRVSPRDRLLADIVKSLINLKFGADKETQEKLLPLAELYQAQYDEKRSATLSLSQKRASS